ncbi:MAG: helix-turn-helix domain-containing protein [Acidimicrobiales bacterium]|jgi:transcriptional regulator with XRE-family HTH domain
MVTEATLASIGERLRSARDRAGLTLDQLAETTGLSKAHLSRLESSERQPSIAALLDLSASLGVQVNVLLGEDRDGAPLSISPGTEPRREANGLAISSRSGFPGSSAIEALSISIDPDRPTSPPARHRGEEWLYVVSGTLGLEYDGIAHSLASGQCAHFDADRPHRLTAVGGVTEILMVAAHDSRSLQALHR